MRMPIIMYVTLLKIVIIIKIKTGYKESVLLERVERAHEKTEN